MEWAAHFYKQQFYLSKADFEGWHKDHEKDTYTQSLKCYLPQQIYELCQQADLDIVGYFPSGAVNFETWQYYEPASIDHCISYRIKLKKK